MREWKPNQPRRVAIEVQVRSRRLCALELRSWIPGVEAALSNYGQGELSPAEIVSLAKRAESSAAQALVLSCTDMRAVEVRDYLESELGKPVVTSNQALMQAALVRLRRSGRESLSASG